MFNFCVNTYDLSWFFTKRNLFQLIDFCVSKFAPNSEKKVLFTLTEDLRAGLKFSLSKKRLEIYHNSWKRFLKLVKFQLLVAKCCRVRKIQPSKFRIIYLYYAGKTYCSFFRAYYEYTQNLQTLQGYIYPILEHFRAKICYFTNFRVTSLAVVIDLLILG